MQLSARRKIKDLAELTLISKKLKASGKKIVHCHGVFDLVHPGHIRHLTAAKKAGDVLIVSITRDRHVKRGPGRPFFNEDLRAEQLASLEVTDYVCAVDYPTAVEAIRAIRPDFYAKGQDYRDRAKDVTGKIHDEEAALASVGGQIHFTDDVTFSSSQLLNLAFEAYPPEVLKYLKAFAKRYSASEVIKRLDALSKLKVLVIGDAIIDQYVYCRPMGKSSKEPIVVNQHMSEETFSGGTMATANHTAQVCRRVDLVTVLGGKNTYEKFITSKLEPGVGKKYFFRGDAPTTVKRRFVSYENNQKFFEVCYLNDALLGAADEKPLVRFLQSALSKYDVVVVNDFGHGMLTPRMIELLSSKSKCLALNVQTNSANIGFNMITKYRKADFVCVDEVELRLAMHDKLSDLKVLVRRAAKMLKAKMVVVTRGKDGSLSYTPKGGFHWTPAFSFKVVDKVGAGDAYFAFASPCFAAGFPQDLVSFVGNAVGSLAVQIVGNREPVRYADLAKFMTRLLKF
jgi:rfaE bifunctional protein kinase chain/domain/rfaE bifunctional protein nucleotidyltransferase chain/domain